MKTVDIMNIKESQHNVDFKFTEDVYNGKKKCLKWWLFGVTETNDWLTSNLTEKIELTFPSPTQAFGKLNRQKNPRKKKPAAASFFRLRGRRLHRFIVEAANG